jgi:putative tryptophan/tyrosine transport system substrate-binding protein
MERRQFIVLLGGAAASRSGAVLAQSAQGTPQPPIVGWLTSVPMRPNPIGDAISAELARLGWVEGKTVTYDVREAPPDMSKLPAIAAELANRPVTIILAPAPPAAAAAQRATRTIPIIALADDVQASGLVSSIARPGANTTGVSIFASELDVKRLALLAELVPAARRIAVVTDSKVGPSMAQLDAAARKLRVELVVVEARNKGEIGPALEAIVASRVEAVNVLASVIFHGGRKTIVARMEAARLPAIYQWPEYPRDEGALIAYGPRQSLIRQLVAGQVDRVLRGAAPGDLPVVQPTKFDLAINMRAARKLGLAPPPSLLARADEVIE